MSSLPARWVRIAVLTAVAAVTFSLSGCGYALAGKGNTLPAWIQIIGVPPIVNHSTVADVDVVLTDAVRAEFQSRGRYRVVPESEGTDALFTATVTSVRLTPVSFNNRQASRYSATVTAQVTFKDKTGKVYVSNRVVQFTEEYDVSTSTDPHDATAFFGQNVNALQRLAKNFAQSVVTSILEAF
jgi:hypothetical protein